MLINLQIRVHTNRKILNIVILSIQNLKTRNHKIMSQDLKRCNIDTNKIIFS